MTKKQAVKKTSKKSARRASHTTARKTARAGSGRAGQAAGTRKPTAGRTAAGSKSATPKAPAAAERHIVVTVGDPHLPNIHDVASKLRSRGMKVDSVLEATGMITGTYSKEPSKLSAVKGVAGVEEPPQFQLPPPGSDVQ